MKKIIKIFGIPSHAAVERTSGVDFCRVIQPMQHLNGYKDDEVEFKVQIYDPKLNEKEDWLKVTAENDILFLNYTTNAWSFAIMGMLARKNKRKIVMDVDDALWDVLPDNTAYRVYEKGSGGITNFTAMCNEVDYMTTTCSYLKNVIVHHTLKRHEKIKVLPNYIDFDLYSHRSPFRDAFNIQLLHFGSSSHFKDLQSEEFNKGVDMIFKEYPNVTLKTVGALIPGYKTRWGARYNHGFGDVDLYKWVREKFPIFMDESDIIVAPLNDNVYNRSKSNIKFLESSSAKKPGCWQEIRQYREVVEDGKNGFLCGTAEKWYESIKKLIEDKELRRKMGEEAFKTTERDWQMKNNVVNYAQFFKSVVSPLDK